MITRIRSVAGCISAGRSLCGPPQATTQSNVVAAVPPSVREVTTTSAPRPQAGDLVAEQHLGACRGRIDSQRLGDLERSRRSMSTVSAVQRHRGHAVRGSRSSPGPMVRMPGTPSGQRAFLDIAQPGPLHSSSATSTLPQAIRGIERSAQNSSSSPTPQHGRSGPGPTRAGSTDRRCTTTAVAVRSR